MKTPQCILTLLAFLAASQTHADVLELKDGKTLDGKYLGGTASTIRFETGGSVQVIETDRALALTFTGTVPATAAAAPAAVPTTAAAAPTATAATPAVTSVTVPAGTALLVRTLDPVSSKDPEGKRFTAKLDTDLVVDGAVVVKAGTKVYGRVQDTQRARRLSGQSKLNLQLTEIAVGPNLVPIMTSGYTETGARSGGKVARSAASGAAIGAIADEDDAGEGAAKGAAIGAGSSGLKKGETATVRPGTLLEFSLQQPVTLSVAP